MSTLRRRLLAPAVTIVTALALAGCGDEAAEQASTDPVDIAITFAAGGVTPDGERVSVAVGQEVDLVVTADEAGELHVHTEPEQEIAYEAGTHTYTVTVDRPGLVDVEAHDLDQLVVQLAVS